jgi:hypothetical protein
MRRGLPLHEDGQTVIKEWLGPPKVNSPQFWDNVTGARINLRRAGRV